MVIENKSIVYSDRRQDMYLPKLSDQEIGRYHSHSSATIGGGVKSNQPQPVIRSSQLQAEYDAISQQLTELKSRLDYLVQICG